MNIQEFVVPKNLKYDGKLYYNNFIETERLIIFANYWSTDNQKKLVMKYDTNENDIKFYDGQIIVTSMVEILNREQYLKERLLDIESEKTMLQNELNEFTMSKVGKIYDIEFVDGELVKNVYIKEIYFDGCIDVVVVEKDIIDMDSFDMNDIKQFIHKPEYDEMAKTISAFIELGKDN